MFQLLPEPPVLRPGSQPCSPWLLSERNEALLPIGDRGQAAPSAVAVPVAIGSDVSHHPRSVPGPSTRTL